MKANQDLWLVTWAPAGKGTGSKPHALVPYFITALQSEVYSYPAAYSRLWLSTLKHSAYNNDLIPKTISVLKSEIRS